ncbi:MAG: HEAT repeat domain-containing protein [Methanobacterium sp.]|uniref:HEAT repeat domain-containing protein n=1 Tax=Methanobacterium sp. TaxID=2164 RepID=UPI003C72A4A1
MDFKLILGLGKPDIKKMEREKDIKGLIRAMGYDNDETIRKEAAFALGKITDSQSPIYTIRNENTLSEDTSDESLNNLTVEELISSLKDNDWSIRMNAAKTLVEIGEPAVENLINSLEDNDWQIRWYAAEILGEIGDIHSIKPLIELLNDKNKGVQSNSSIALIKIGKPSVELLIDNLNSKEWQIREHVAEILGEIGDIHSIKPLENSLNDENGDVRMAVKVSIEKINNK